MVENRSFFFSNKFRVCWLVPFRIIDFRDTSFGKNDERGESSCGKKLRDWVFFNEDFDDFFVGTSKLRICIY